MKIKQNLRPSPGLNPGSVKLRLGVEARPGLSRAAESKQPLPALLPLPSCRAGIPGIPCNSRDISREEGGRVALLRATAAMQHPALCLMLQLMSLIPRAAGSGTGFTPLYLESLA